MTSEPAREVHTLLQRYHLDLSKGLGQNLLVDGTYFQHILAAAALTPADVVLEIGPGLGILTRLIAARAGQVIAVELDHRMVQVLEAELGTRIKVVEGDILRTDITALLQEFAAGVEPGKLNYKVVANLPYYITSAALRHLLSAPVRPSLMVLMVQYEVAQRLAAPAGKLSLLGLSVQVYGQVRIVCKVPAGAFYPPPQVDSAVVLFTAYPEPAIPESELELFFRLAKAGFGQKRKQLHNSLAAGTRQPAPVVLQALEEAGIAPTRRAESLSLAEWHSLCAAWPADKQDK